MFFIGRWDIGGFNGWYLFAIPLIVASAWIFYLSHNFQFQILFDQQTEEERQSDFDRLVKSISKQAAAIELQTKILNDISKSISSKRVDS